MATFATTAKQRYYVYAPDAIGEYAGERFAVRARHLEGAKQLTAAGILKVGGMTVSPEYVSSGGKELSPVASMLIYEAESIDAVKKMVEEDIYYTSNVWDKEKIVILPILIATPLP